MIRENLRFHLWPFESFRLLLLDGTKLAFQLFRSNFLCRNTRNISLSRLKSNSTDRTFFFVSFFSAHDLISFSNFVIQRRSGSESERARERERERERERNEEFHVRRRVCEKKKEKKRKISCAARVKNPTAQKRVENLRNI